MKRTRRHHGAAVKAQGAFAACQGDKTLAEWATQFGGHPTQITDWKQHVRARAVDVCGGTTSTSDAPDLTVLHAKIGPLALKHDCLEGARIKAGVLSATRCSPEPIPCLWCGHASSGRWRVRPPTLSLVRCPRLIWRGCAGSTRYIWPLRVPEPGYGATCCGEQATGSGARGSAP